jgi:solute carrier family 25 (mitochondrial adenine nucleotide translocator), member 4/5/6/31
MDCISQIVKNESVKAFYNGAFSNVLRGTGSALVLVFYEKMQKYMLGTRE